MVCCLRDHIIAESYGKSIFRLLKALHTDFQAIWNNLYSSQQLESEEMTHL